MARGLQRAMFSDYMLGKARAALRMLQLMVVAKSTGTMPLHHAVPKTTSNYHVTNDIQNLIADHTGIQNVCADFGDNLSFSMVNLDK